MDWPALAQMSLGASLAVGAFLARDWYRFRSSREWWSREEHERFYQDLCAHLEEREDQLAQRLVRGDTKFEQLTRGQAEIALYLKRICQELVGEPMDCERLDRIILGEP